MKDAFYFVLLIASIVIIAISMMSQKAPKISERLPDRVLENAKITFPCPTPTNSMYNR